MPNFIIEYSESLSEQISASDLMDTVYQGAKNSGHFPPEVIKVRTQVRSDFRLYTGHSNFLHVAGHILSGRTDAQKAEISSAVMAQLKTLKIKSTFVSAEIVDIHRESFLDHST